MVFERIKLGGFLDAGKDLLANRAEDDGAAFLDEVGKFSGRPIGPRDRASKGQRPNGRVDEDVQALRRCFL